MSFLRFLAWPVAAWLAGASLPAHAQDPFDPADEEDRVAIEALALYPEDVRNHILEASTEAGLLDNLDELQEASQDDFRALLDPYPEEVQQDLFDLSRYPDLVAAIAEGGPKSRGELERLASRYPDDVRELAVRQGLERHRVIQRMDALLEDFDERFDDLVEGLSPRKREAFQALLGMPEVLTLLVEHEDMTALVGDAYERDPAGTRDRFADLALEVARRNAEEADDWKASVDRDPDLRRDYEAAARDYERDTGYGAYAAPSASVNVVVNPYPFWVGYPWWYPVRYVYYDPWYWWYPRRHWGHCGWSFGPRFYFSFSHHFHRVAWRPWYPTPFFTSWYFSFGHHHARYPFLSDHYVSFYERPLVVNQINVVNIDVDRHYHFNKRVVRKFVYESERVVSRDFLRGPRDVRVKRFREYGRLAPELERIQVEGRRAELQRRGGRGDGLRVPRIDRMAERESTRRKAAGVLRERQKDAPDLARFAREPRADELRGERGAGGGGRERGRGEARDLERRRDGPDEAERERGRGRGGERERARAVPGAGEDRERAGARRGGERGRAEDDAEARRPRERALEGGERGERGRGDAARRGRDRDAEPDAGTRREREVERGENRAQRGGEGARRERATPTFEREERGEAGRGAGRGREAGDGGRARPRDAAPEEGGDADDRRGGEARRGQRSGRATPSFERPERGARSEPREREAVRSGRAAERAQPRAERETRGAEPRVERRAEPRVERRAEPRMERRAEPRMERRAEPRVERRAEPRMERRAEPRMERRAEPRMERRAEPRVERRAEPRVERRPEPRPRDEARSGGGGGRERAGGGGGRRRGGDGEGGDEGERGGGGRRR